MTTPEDAGAKGDMADEAGRDPGQGALRDGRGQTESADVPPPAAFRHLPLFAAVAVMLFAVATALVSTPQAAPPTAHRFESGHRIVAAGGARWDWHRTPAGVEVRVLGGEVMFDVDPDADESLRVQAGAVTVRVTGTVFTVEHWSDVTRVALFEGSVALTGADLYVIMEPGDRWEGEAGGGVSRDDAAFEPRLSTEAREAAERRADRDATLLDFVPVLPEVPDLAADMRGTRP